MALNIPGLKQRHERGGAGWSPTPGKNRIRVLPPTSEYFGGEIDYIAHKFEVHFVKFADGSDTFVTRCPRDTGGQCPICAWSYANKDSADPAVKALASDLRSTSRFVMNILDLTSQDTAAKGVQPYEANWTVYNGIYKIASNPNWGDILSLSSGRNFIVTLTPPRTGENKTGWNKYDTDPEPEKTTVEKFVKSLDGWPGSLDGLEARINETMSDEAIAAALGKLGIGPAAGGGTAPTGAAPSAGAGYSGGAAPATPAAPAAPATPSAPAAPAADAAPAAPADGGDATPALPWEDPASGNDTAQAAAQPAPAEPASTPSAPAAGGGKTYPPGLEIGPDGHPVCFGDFDPDEHPCNDCPDAQECTFKALNIGGGA